MTTRSTIWTHCWVIGCLLTLASSTSWAHNGRLSLAFPVQDIVLDGDLSDWPDGMPRYAVTMAEAGSPPTGPDDFSAEFRAGYDLAHQHLYVAVEVTDDSIVLDTPAPSWSNVDGCDVFVGLEHAIRGGAVAQMTRWGMAKHAYGPVTLNAFDVEVRATPGQRVYEWRIDVGRLKGGAVELAKGSDLAFDVVVSDMDADGSFHWMAWGPMSQKMISPLRLGDLMLVEDGSDLEETVRSAGEVIQRTEQRTRDEARELTSYLALLSESLLAVALLHLMLFGFQRESKTNLYYAIYTLCTAAAVFASFQFPVTSVPGVFSFTNTTQLAALGIGVASFALLVFGSALLFLYAFFYERIPFFGRVLLGLMAAIPICTAFAALLGQIGGSEGIGAMTVLGAAATIALPLLILGVFVELPRIVLAAVLRRKPGAWSVGVGFLVFAVVAVMLVFRLVSREPIDPWLLLGVVLPLGTMSFRLARSVATIHRDLAARYQEVEALSQQLREQNRALELANIQIREQSQRVAEADRLKSDFLARMSHDLRTPLNAIIGYTRILLRRVKDDVEPRQYTNLENIRVSADNLLALINDILDLSRIESGRSEIRIDEVDVKQLISDCHASVASLVAEQVELITDVDPDLPTIRSDSDRLQRVLMNLTGNAIKYTEQGRIELRAKRDGGGVVVTVSDTGLGIPPDDLPHIFDEFRQVDRRDRKREGSGLGLAIARKSVEMLGGTIAVDSVVGSGSTFVVTLPLSAPDTDPAAATDASPTST